MADVKELRELLKTLSAQKELLEIEADAIHSELTSPGPDGEPPAGIKDSLVDEEGFPRGDIDIYNVRRKRQRLSSINYEHKELMKRIEENLQKLHSLSPLEPSEPLESKPDLIEASVQVSAVDIVNFLTERAIAKLDEILPDSPACMAGIQEGDQLVKFGHITAKTANPLPSIAKLVGESVSKPIEVVVRRAQEVRRLSLTPQPWGGRGLLGCHLTPL